MVLLHCSPDRSYCICGPSLEGVGNDDFYETKSNFGVQVVQVCQLVLARFFPSNFLSSPGVCVREREIILENNSSVMEFFCY